ncbi:MAG: DUF362 domain-containing protein [Candidatus Bathyarchaeota archaeon]|nr:DUF362 domain-containing protein [Candidatus Bathyarchaeota archaeon]
MKVAIIKGANPSNMTVKALEMINGNKVLPLKKPVLIKPNYLNANHPSTGITTDSRIIEGVIKFLKKYEFENIIIGEGSGFADTFEAFHIAGVDLISKKFNVKTVDLNKDEFIEKKPLHPLNLEKVKIAKTALESSIISIPKLKPHRIAGASLSIKNMMGAMTPKGSMHSNLSKNIVDLASIIKPDLAVIDGIIAGQGHESSGNPLIMNLVIAGIDPVAVDTVGASIMGIPIDDIKHLAFAEKKGLGTADLNRIEILGEPIEKVRKNFERSILSGLLRYFG